ncbi:Radical SAM domain protein [Denitrovibrio acetiphilus DSM 12809]|uniref:Radical SAM domain protein n=1 Tax=Denitrovibrio acetiphilus (strain DSM 12809 / NBRC 114555 / N2460) TaxID=522772 RepID=D4H7P2_DENA2|nr:TIGR03960 family B12-binding radical SAM protein [Denitrovibrio acetiphilus]ADD68041.1 Radical SAM domain protein [Denitrovibrio acetiphilus DSM 12809]
MKDYKRLLEVSKPARYINGEINSFHKTHEGRTTFCLVFPDIYEVGISHIGYKMLYERLNRLDTVACERFFTPWVDAIDKFGSEMFVSLESSTNLRSFDIVGFSIQYELSYTNMLLTLQQSNIPLRSKDRTEDDPIILAGGPCVVNPMPIAPFMDVFFVGESEITLPEAVDRLHQMKNEGAGRRELLEYLNSLPYTYVPEIDPDKHVVRSIYTGFSQDTTIEKLIVPTIPAVQDRVAVEISRGCTRGCRFCQAGVIYRPNRERSVDNIACDALTQLSNTGYLETSLLSLSASDYSRLEELLVTMVKLTSSRKVSLSLPSIRADRIKEFMFRELSKVRKSGFTIAPEAGSQRMRDAINKGLTEESILNAVEKASDAGWNGAKLYFMIGLPGETMEDVLAIAELARKAKMLRKGRFNIKVSVSNFVPKSHTPYQWFGQNSGDDFFNKKKELKEVMKKYKIPCSFHGIRASVLEGVFSRGSVELADVIEEALLNGARYDAWSEHFSYDIWEAALSKFGYKDADFAERIFGKDEKLPWDNIDVGVRKEFLWREYERSEQLIATHDCTNGNCSECGVCDFETVKNEFSLPASINTDTAPAESDVFERYALVFSKVDRMSLLSAIETQRLFTHVLTLADIGLKFSAGFNPQPKLSYVQAASSGLEGYNEVVLFESAPIEDINKLLEKINSFMPPGVNVRSINKFTIHPKKFDTYIRLTFREDLFSLFRDKYLKGEAFYKKLNKKGDEKVLNAASFVVSLGDKDVVLKTETTGNFNCYEFFESLGYHRADINMKRLNTFLLERV